MTTGRWYRISGDSPQLGLRPTRDGTRCLEDNDPARDASLNPPGTARERLRRMLGREWLAPWSGRQGFSAITEAWNSAVYASRFGVSGSMIVFGGGHDDYFGSDVHAFDLERREWRRLMTGYVTGSADEYGEGAVYPNAEYPDGSPLPPHTYDYVQYDEVGNNYLLLKGQIELGPRVKAIAIPHLLNLDSLTWKRGPEHPSAILSSGGFTTWDAKRRVLWGHSGDDGGGNAFIAYCPDGANHDGTIGSWRELHPNKLQGEANHNAMQYSYEEDSIIVSIHSRNQLASIDPNDPGSPVRAIRSCGERPTIQEYSALEYAPKLRSLVYYSAADGPVVYRIDLDSSAHWRKLTNAASFDPVADAATQTRHRCNLNHTFGRFRIAGLDEFDLALLVRHVDSPVYAMRLPTR
jgi:hypothetical protein